MIRVLQVVTHMNRGGLETMLMNYYRNIDRSQIQFDFLTHRPYDGDYGKEIKELGGVIYHLPRMNPYSITYRQALKRFFDENSEYKIVHVHQDCMSSVILKEAQRQGIPVRIAHSHSSSQDKNWKYILKLLYKTRISKYATDLMACGEQAGKWMFGNCDFLILNNAIDARLYSFNLDIRRQKRKELGIRDDELLLGHVGRFSYPKNHNFLIDIFQNISSGTKAKLLLVGDGELRGQIEAKVQKLGLSDRVIFTGLRADVAELMQAMDVFVFPSNYEGLPVTMVEAQAAGLPCFISTNVPDECILTSLVKQSALSEGAEKWADIILAGDKKRLDTYETIKEKGFDIIENAKWLQDYYSRKAMI